MTTAISQALPRALFATAALFGTLAGFAVTTQPAAAANGGSYTVSLASALAEPRREIVNGVLWRCEGQTCTATADGSRDIMACRRVAKAIGEVTGFVSPAGTMKQEDIARCNAK
jgi:hypothetical protein